MLAVLSMQNLDVLITFTGGLAGALVLGYGAARIKLSPIVGYLLAGVALGPFTPGFVANRGIAEQFAEIGVILLLFGIGLRFHLRELMAVWRIALPGALIQSAISTFTLAFLLRFFGWSWASGLVLGMGISVASTVVMALVLGQHHDLHARIGHIAIGWTVVEDLMTVTALILLPIWFGGSVAAESSAALALGLAALKILGLIAVVLVLGRYVLPFALERIERTRSRELFTLAVLVLALGIAVGAAGLFGVSMALGAFLAGLAVGRSEFAARAASDAVPMRDAFAVLFFVSVGMLFDPKSLVEEPYLVLVVLVVVVLVKPLAAAVTVRALGLPLGAAIPVGAAFSQVGEFSFILGTVARSLGLLSDSGWNALVAASILSIALNPTIYRLARRLGLSARGGSTVAPQNTRPTLDPNHCVLVGYGPVGQIVERLLTERGKTVTIVDLNLETIRRLKGLGKDAVYGDVLRSGTLEEIGIARAGRLILSADVEDAAEVIRNARSQNPELTVLARCTHLRDAAALRRAGASVVAAGEAEVGVSLVEAVTEGDGLHCGAAAAQREEIRRGLYGEAAPTEPAPTTAAKAQL